MEIRYLGHASFHLKGKTGSVVTDPFDQKIVGIPFPKIDSTIVTLSHEHADHNKSELIGGEPLVIRHPGEYEKQGIRVTGISVFHDSHQGKQRGKNTMYKIEIDGVSLLHCGDLGHILTDSVIDELGEIDVLLVPVGGVYTIGPKEAIAVSESIEPSYVIPMHFKDKDINSETFGELAQVSEFIKLMGVTPDVPVKKVSIKKEDLQESVKVILMERS